MNGEPGQRRWLSALALGSGAMGYGAAMAALGLWPGAGAAVGVGAVLGGLLAWAWRAEPEVEREEPEPQPQPSRRPEPGPRSQLQPQRPPPPEAEEWLRAAVLQAIAPSIVEPRHGRDVGKLRLPEVIVNDISYAGTPTPVGVNVTAHVEGQWLLPWRRHPLPGLGEKPFEELGTFSCTVVRESGYVRVHSLSFSSDFFESLLTWIAIPAGEFFMGSVEDPQAFEWERPQHRVSVEAFSLGATSVTVGQYAAVTGRAVDPVDAELPVTHVSWEDAIDFCNALSRLAGRRSCYGRREGAIAWDRTADGFRLPDEEEWEYACRAGTTTRYSFGDEEKWLKDYGWYGEDFYGTAHPVAHKEPNPWGLYDMHGNVWEWVWNEWEDSYAGKMTIDNDEVARLVSPLGVARVVRGGSFWREPARLRSAFRFRFPPGKQSRFLGFRCAASARRPG